MERDKKIVYLCTENNAKCALGLKGILEDGWNVDLVIAYVHPTSEVPNASLRQALRQRLKSLLCRFPAFYDLLRRLVNKQGKMGISIEDICAEHRVRYRSTSDKPLISLRECIMEVRPDVILSNGWQFRISEDIFKIPKIISLNCHSSYLPEYRGGNVTYAPLINEESQSGVTAHELVSNFDAGPILAQERVSISPGETPQSLNLKRAHITGRVLIQALEVTGHPQLYKPNPPSPFYFRCDYKIYRRYRQVNGLRKLVGLPMKRYQPKERYDI